MPTNLSSSKTTTQKRGDSHHPDLLNRALAVAWIVSVTLYLVLYGSSTGTLLRGRMDFSRLVAVPVADLGSRAPYPDWVHGHWVRLDRTHANADTVLSLVQKYHQRGIPVRAVVLDHGWAEPGTWRLDRHRFGNSSGGPTLDIITALHKLGIRVVLDVNPLLQEATSDYNFALKQDWFLKPIKGDSPIVTWDDGSGVSPVRGGLLDVTSSAAREWLKRRIADLLDTYPIDGFKNDAVDSLFAQLGSGTKGALGAASAFVSQANWSRTYYWTFFDAGRREGLDFDRVTVFRPVDSVFGSHFEAFGPTDISFACWIGNHPPSFAGLRASLMNAIHSSFRGYINIGTTVGGSAGKDVDELLKPSATLQDAVVLSLRRRELMLRWSALGAFMPFFENGGFEDVHAPWRVGCVAAGQPTAKHGDAPRYVVRCPASSASRSLLEDAYLNAVMLHRALSVYFYNTATATFYSKDLHLWAPMHGSAELHAARDRATWSAESSFPHPPFYPLARSVTYDEPEEFTFLAGRDLLLVPVVHSVLDGPFREQVSAAVKLRLEQLPRGSTSVDLHDVDDILKEAIAVARQAFADQGRQRGIRVTFPASGVWVDATSDAAVGFSGGGSTTFLPVPAPDAAIPLFLRAGAIIPLNLESVTALLEPPPRRGRLADRGRTLIGAIFFRLPSPTITPTPPIDPIVLLVPFPGLAPTANDELQLYGEHDSGFIAQRNVTGRSDGTFMMRITYSAYHRPVLVVVRGVRCVRCTIPDATFELVDSKRFEEVIQQRQSVERRVAAAFIREPRGEFAMYDPLSSFGLSIDLGPFA